MGILPQVAGVYYRQGTSHIQVPRNVLKGSANLGGGKFGLDPFIEGHILQEAVLVLRH